MIYYITKYATTRGIIEADTDLLKNHQVSYGSDLFISYRDGTMLCLSGGEWYTDKKMALADAEARRQRKIASLKRQIERLEAMKFD